MVLIFVHSNEEMMDSTENLDVLEIIASRLTEPLVQVCAAVLFQ